MTRRFLLMIAALAAMVLTGSCRGPQHAARVSPVDLGVVELSDRVSSRYNLGAGESCVITPTVLRASVLDLQVAFDRQDQTGKPVRVASRRVEALADQRVEVSFPFISLVFTPRIKHDGS